MQRNQQQLSYGAELQAQIAADEERRRREKMDRLGIGPGGPQQQQQQPWQMPGRFEVPSPFLRPPQLMQPLLPGSGLLARFGGLGGPSSPGASFGYRGPPSPGAGFSYAGPQGPGPEAQQRAEARQRQNQYRAELEAQMRDREQQRAQQRAMQAGDEGRGRQRQSFEMPQPAAFQVAPPMAGAGSFGFGAGVMMAPQNAMPGWGPAAVGGFCGFPAGGMMYGGPPPPSMGPAGNQPIISFRNGKYDTPNELNARAQQKAELQADLQRQIAEKQYIRNQEQMQRKMEQQQDEARLRAGQDQLRQQFEVERRRDGGGGPGGGGPVDKVADAWEKARLEVEEKRRNKFAHMKGARMDTGGASEGGPWPANQLSPRGDVPQLLSPSRRVQMVVPTEAAVQPHLMVVDDRAMERVRQAAEKEIGRLREEIQLERADIQQEAAQLRQVVTEQSQEVAALRAHAHHLACEALEMKQRANFMVLAGLVPGGLPGQPPVEAPKGMPDITFDAPSPAAILRQRHAAQWQQEQEETEDVTLAAERGRLQGDAVSTSLEESMMAESVLVFPGQRFPLAQPLRVKSGLGTVAEEAHPGVSPAGHPPVTPAAGEAEGLQQEEEAAARPGSEKQEAGELQLAVKQSPLQQQAVAAQQQQQQQQHALIRQVTGAPRMGAQAAGMQPWSAAPPRKLPDVDVVMRQNRDKLGVLQELTHLKGSQSLEAIDEFLIKFSKLKPDLPDRTQTPILRILTPEYPNGPVGQYSGQYSNGGMPPLPPPNVSSAPLSPYDTDLVRIGSRTTSGRASRAGSLQQGGGSGASGGMHEDALDAELKRVSPSLPPSTSRPPSTGVVPPKSAAAAVPVSMSRPVSRGSVPALCTAAVLPAAGSQAASRNGTPRASLTPMVSAVSAGG